MPPPRAIFCDLDGCLISGNRLLPGAAQLVERAGARLHLLSNNSTDTRETLSARLAALGLAIAPEQMTLAGVAAVDHLVGQSSSAARLFASDALRAYAATRGLNLAAAPTHILLARDVTFDYRKLEALVAHARDGVHVVVSNPDASHPGADGYPVPETGALFEALRCCVPEVAYTVIGKPEPLLYDAALRATGWDASQVLAIGDNPLTDGEGARRCAMAFALVGQHADARYPSLAELVADQLDRA